MIGFMKNAYGMNHLKNKTCIIFCLRQIKIPLRKLISVDPLFPVAMFKTHETLRYVSKVRLRMNPIQTAHRFH